ncbi:flavin reductase family protein [Paenibacillus sp. P96]|uniref:Flavin reductase family protein n=1 Tax=Paenibacillus zeirhizosphaerae TaxID=2987519 RepID=A0ABT9FPG0_9BACL|nr:flavin reductase family protein [Paenibacillus sp. P96]MDP4096600.1 flavin reductase family protein [Paenibacillus sp. P96]
MISIDPNTLDNRGNYKLLTGSIIPRPIAFVTTLSEHGVLNGAPFSYFSIVSAAPPLISVSVQRVNGKQKDTARNAAQAGEFVVHITDEDNVEAVNKTAAALPPTESEVEAAGLTPLPSSVVKVPGIAESKMRMECRLERSIPLGEEGQEPSCDLLIGRVVCYHISEEVYQNTYIDPSALRAVSRLAGNDYAKLGERFILERPN